MRRLSIQSKAVLSATNRVAGPDLSVFNGKKEEIENEFGAFTNQVLINKPSHGFATPSSGLLPIYKSLTSWSTAVASSMGTMADMALISVVDQDNFYAQLGGRLIVEGHGLTIGSWYVLTEDPGGFAEESLFTGLYKQRLFFVPSEDEIYLRPERFVFVEEMLGFEDPPFTNPDNSFLTVFDHDTQGALLPGTYGIELTYKWNQDTTNSDFEGSLEFDGQVLGLGDLIHKQEPKDSAGNLAGTGSGQIMTAYHYYEVTVTIEGIKNLLFEIRADRNNRRSSVWNARMKIFEKTWPTQS